MNPTQSQPTPKHTHTKPPFKVWMRRKPSVSDCGEVEIGIQTDYPEALCNGSRSIAILTGGGFTREDSPNRAEVLADNIQLAAFIVRACNSHPALVAENKRLREAAKTALAALQNLHELQQWDKQDGDRIDEAVDAENELRAALAKEDV